MASKWAQVLFNVQSCPVLFNAVQRCSVLFRSVQSLCTAGNGNGKRWPNYWRKESTNKSIVCSFVLFCAFLALRYREEKKTKSNSHCIHLFGDNAKSFDLTLETTAMCGLETRDSRLNTIRSIIGQLFVCSLLLSIGHILSQTPDWLSSHWNHWNNRGFGLKASEEDLKLAIEWK